MGIVFAVAILAVDALVVLVAAAAFARFAHDDWRIETRWARRPRLAGAIERFAFARLDPLRAFIVWLAVAGLLTAFVAVPALFYLLGRM